MKQQYYEDLFEVTNFYKLVLFIFQKIKKKLKDNDLKKPYLLEPQFSQSLMKDWKFSDILSAVFITNFIAVSLIILAYRQSVVALRLLNIIMTTIYHIERFKQRFSLSIKEILLKVRPHKYLHSPNKNNSPTHFFFSFRFLKLLKASRIDLCGTASDGLI